MVGYEFIVFVFECTVGCYFATGGWSIVAGDFGGGGFLVFWVGLGGVAK